MRLLCNGNTATTSTTNETTGNDGKALTFDPFIFLGTSEGKKATYRCVTDYVSLPLKDQRFRDVDSGLELSVTNSKLSVGDWTTQRQFPKSTISNILKQDFKRNVRVDKVNTSFIMDYIGYLIKISTNGSLSWYMIENTGKLKLIKASTGAQTTIIMQFQSRHNF